MPSDIFQSFRLQRGTHVVDVETQLARRKPLALGLFGRQPHLGLGQNVLGIRPADDNHAIIIGDAGCQSGTAAFQAAVDNRTTWGPVVDSEVVILSTDPNNNNTPQLVDAGIKQVILNGGQFYTSVYVSLGCAYQNAPANTISIAENRPQ